MLADLCALIIVALSLPPGADSSAVRRDSVGAVADSLPMRLRSLGLLSQDRPGPGRVVSPAGVSVDAFGTIYVTDVALNRLQRYDKRGAWLGEAGTLGSDAGQMRKPTAVATVGTLSVAVLDVENRRILSYDLSGQLRGTLIDLDGESLKDRVGRIDPVALAADRGGAFYIADAERDRLLAFDFGGNYVRTLGGYGARPGSFRGLCGLAVSRRGDLVTTERVNARLQWLDPGGRVLDTWALPVSPGRGGLPVAVDDSARIAVADELSGQLWVFDRHGRTVAATAGLKGPRGLAFARDGSLLVTEAAAGRVRRLALESQLEGAAAPKE